MENKMRKPFIKVHISEDGVLKLTDAGGNRITNHTGISITAPHGGMPTLTITFACHVKQGVTVGPLAHDQFGDVHFDVPPQANTCCLEEGAPKPAGLVAKESALLAELVGARAEAERLFSERNEERAAKDTAVKQLLDVQAYLQEVRDMITRRLTAMGRK